VHTQLDGELPEKNTSVELVRTGMDKVGGSYFYLIIFIRAERPVITSYVLVRLLRSRYSRVSILFVQKGNFQFWSIRFCCLCSLGGSGVRTISFEEMT
jgi:hypothetical protein